MDLSKANAKPMPAPAVNLASIAEPGASVPGPSIREKPIVVIEAGRTWKGIDFRDLWAHRELLYFLTWRDIKVRYKQTLLGATWALIQPLLTMVIFSFIFGRVARVDSRGVPYPLFAYAALLPWTFLATAVTTGGNSLVASAHVITKVYFPRLLVPTASVAAALLDFAIAFLFLVVLMFHYGIRPTVGLLFLPILLVLTTLLALGTGILLSALNVKYRDVRHAIPFLIQVWMLVSPVAYSSSAVPPKWRLLYSINPVAGLVESYRASLLGLPFPWPALAISAAITLALLLYAVFEFRRMERVFADII